MKCIYISGAITGISNWTEHFQKGEQYLLEKYKDDDLIIRNPLHFPKLECKDPDEEWLAYMKMSIHQLMECDTIYMLKGWEDSKGAKIEHHIAQDLNYNIMYEE